jgi:hypothetical protein
MLGPSSLLHHTIYVLISASRPYTPRIAARQPTKRLEHL